MAAVSPALAVPAGGPAARAVELSAMHQRAGHDACVVAYFTGPGLWPHRLGRCEVLDASRIALSALRRGDLSPPPLLPTASVACGAPGFKVTVRAVPEWFNIARLRVSLSAR
jgi:hypothetical protein